VLSQSISSSRKTDSHGPVGFWFFNDGLNLAEIDYQLDQFVKQKFSGVVVHPRDGLSIPWQSETWFEVLEYIIGACSHRNLKVWYYDDAPYPSGSAGGRLIQQSPELAGKSLLFVDKVAMPVQGVIRIPFSVTGCLLKVYAAAINSDNDLTDVFKDITHYAGLVGDRWFVQGERTVGYGPMFINDNNHPHWRAFIEHENWVLHWPVNNDQQYRILAVFKTEAGDTRHGKYVDLLNPETTERFIELSYNTTLKRLGASRFKNFAAAFTDEPRLCSPYPWTDTLPDDYYRAYNEDIFQILPHLAIQISDYSYEARYRYRRLLGQLWEERFMKPLAQWCQQNGLPLTGHISPEEDPILQTLGSPGLTRLITHMQWLGYDLVLKPFGSSEQAKLVGPKLISSIAHQKAKPHLVTETMGCCGENLTINEMFKLINWLAVCSYDTFILHGQYMSLDGHRKREAPPSIFFQSPYWNHFHKLSEYISELSQWNSQGKPVRPIAVLYPTAAFEALVPVDNNRATALAVNLAELTGGLTSAALEFDFVADHDLVETNIVGSKGNNYFQIGDAVYETLILPDVSILDDATIKTIEQLRDAKITIFSLTKKIGSINSQRNVDFLSMDKQHVILQLVQLYRSWVSFPSDRRLYVQTRTVNDKNQRMLWNPEDHPIAITIRGGEDITFAVSSTLPFPNVKKNKNSENILNLEPFQLIIITDRTPSANSVDTLMRPADDDVAKWEDLWHFAPQEVNTLLLSHWNLELSDSIHAVQLPARSGVLPWNLAGQTVKMWCEIIIDDIFKDAELWWEKSTFGGPYELSINGKKISPLERAHEHSSYEMHANLNEFIVSGVNRVEVVVGPIQRYEPAMLEPLQLKGWFRVLRLNDKDGGLTADLRPDWYKKLLDDDPTLSRIGPLNKIKSITEPTDWTKLGFPQYSGTISYQNKLHIKNTSNRIFLEADPNQVDAFELFVNGLSAGVCCWSPFRLEISEFVKKGINVIEVRVSNTSINRTEGKAQPSGLNGNLRILISACTEKQDTINIPQVSVRQS